MIRLLERGHDDIRVVEKEILIRSTYKCSYFPELGVTYFRDDSLIYRDPPEYIYKGELVVVKREVHSYQGWSNNMAASATHYYIQKGA